MDTHTHGWTEPKTIHCFNASISNQGKHRAQFSENSRRQALGRLSEKKLLQLLLLTVSTWDTSVLGLQVRGVVTSTRVEVMQHRISDVHFAVSTARTASVQVPQHILRAPGNVCWAASTAATQRHTSVAGTLHQDDLIRTRTVGDKVLRLAIIYNNRIVPQT